MLKERPSVSARAFSLVELLTVVAIISIMATMATLTISGNSNATQLSSAGNTVVDLANQARQNSITQNALTALVLVNNSGRDEWDNRLIAILELKPGATTWSMVSRWQLLPSGVIIDPQQSTAFTSTSPAIGTALGALKFQGVTLASGTYVYQVFLPEGRLLSATENQMPPNLCLVGGIMKNSSAKYLTTQQGGVPVNYYNVTINMYTGIPNVGRPN